MCNFRPVDRKTPYLLPPLVEDWLPERHLARFVVKIVEGLNLSAMSGAYRGSGSASYHPAVLLAILVYGYVTGVFSSRKLERATYDTVAFRFVAANQHPDHDTLAAFRKRFLKEIEALFVKILLLAREMGVLKLGTVALDGTKVHANASRHSALSYEHACLIEAQLQADVTELLAKAEAADKADLPDGMSIPEELARREERLKKIAEANVKACAAAGIEPLIAMNRDSHHPSLSERFAEAPPVPEDPRPVEAMAHRLKAPEGKKLYAKRKRMPEPVFGIVREDVLAPLGLNVARAAKALGVTRQALSNMLNGRTSLTAEMALRVEKAFGPKMEHPNAAQLRSHGCARPRQWHTCGGLPCILAGRNALAGL